MRTRIAAFLLLALVSAASAENLMGNCDIRFLGTSTLHDFSGTARCQPFPVNVSGGTDEGRNLRGVEIVVPVEEMDTKNGKRDKQMREMFEYDKFPHVRAVLSALDPDKLRQQMRNDPNGEGNVEISLKIRDIEHKIQATVRNLRETSGRVIFDVSFPVSLRSYKLRPPAVLFGAIRVGDKVDVTAAFRLEAEPAR